MSSLNLILNTKTGAVCLDLFRLLIVIDHFENDCTEVYFEHDKTRLNFLGDLWCFRE